MAAQAINATAEHWDMQYRSGHVPWETDRPASELQRVRRTWQLAPSRAVDLGCGTGASAVWLAQQGFEVTAVDLSRCAIRSARRRAAPAGVDVDFRVGDLAASDLLRGPFDFFYDGGCYHAIRRGNAEGYFRTVERITRPGAWGLVLSGNAAEPEDKNGPPVLEEWEIRHEWGRAFDILQLCPFRFDPPRAGGKRYLGWSCVLRRST
jgi:SAM-dependent methyltransferase